MLQRFKKWMLPIAMITGALFYRYVGLLSFLTPWLIFIMLLVTYCKLSLRQLNLSPLHVWLLGIQIVGGLTVYGLLYGIDPLVAEGAFICVFCPTATAAAVITGMLGGDIACLATYSLLSNLTVAFTAPLLFSFMGEHVSLPFFESLSKIGSEMIPLLIMPFFCAIALQKFLPQVHAVLQKRQSISFYLWAVSLTIVMGKTVSFIMSRSGSEYREELLIALFALIVCLIQFLAGKLIGRKYGQTIAGGQGLGQKNTVLAIWMALTYLNPLASIGPASYVVWQNCFNSWQLWVKEKQERTVISKK